MKRRAGFSLLEALVASFILTVGSLGLFSAVSHVFRAVRTRTFQSDAVAAYGRIAAQVQAARCDVDPTTAVAFDPALVDPGLAGHIGAGWVATYDGMPSNTIDHVGQVGPSLLVEYRVDITPPATPIDPPTLMVQFRLSRPDEIGPLWRTEFTMQKRCFLLRTATTGRGRGAYP